MAKQRTKWATASGMTISQPKIKLFDDINGKPKLKHPTSSTNSFKNVTGNQRADDVKHTHRTNTGGRDRQPTPKQIVRTYSNCYSPTSLVGAVGGCGGDSYSSSVRSAGESIVLM